jgi:membrane protease YdiL (CAAX protease family)
MIQSPLLRRFLGLEQIDRLHRAWRENTSREIEGRNGIRELAISLAIALLPSLSFYIPRAAGRPDPTTILIGIATLLAIVYRVQKKVPFFQSSGWSRDLSLTHTAFALGCIPAVLIVIFYPESLYTLKQARQPGVRLTPIEYSNMARALFVLKVAIWAGVTEEFIFRGLLIGVIRRTRLFLHQRQRDIFAVLLSSVIFGLGHLPVWGPAMSLALTGLGVGFGIAFIAIGEAILPLILYHILFDICSLSAAYFQYKV